MRAILIDVEAKELREVELPTSEPINKQCDAINEFIGGGCSMFCHVRLSDNMSMWVDDEGLLQERTKGFIPIDRKQPIMGNGLITGMQPHIGDIVDLDPEYTVEKLAECFNFVEYDSHTQVPVSPIKIIPLGDDFNAKDKE